ncbi:MAG: hypothetical protein NWQ07_10170 [Flaviramulus sp.]|nr:hypothetical protein [Flaviramulus sp.]
MKKGIRDLFNEDEVIKNNLPKNHRQEFYNKLKASRKQNTARFEVNYLIKVAAIAILFLGLTFLILKPKEKASNQIADESKIVNQIDAIEKQYLANINKEWQNFIAIAMDENLVKRYKQKLDELSSDYQNISIQFKKDSNNITVIEALVENLQTRLQLLKDIQEHIKLINQKNEQYETITL